MARSPFEYEYQTEVAEIPGNEAYQGIVSWFTTPITTLVSLIIPLMFYRVGFTSDWDVLYMSDVRVQCMLIGIGFDLAGYILMTLPYLFLWDYTDEKHAHVMEVLKQRAEAGNKEAETAGTPVSVVQATDKNIKTGDEL